MHNFNCNLSWVTTQKQPSTPMILRGRKKVLKTCAEEFGPDYVYKIKKKGDLQLLDDPTTSNIRLSLQTPRNFNKLKQKNIKKRTLQSTEYNSVNQVNFQKQNFGQQIRHHLDQNLHRIYQFLNQRTLDLNRQNNKIYNNDRLRGPKLEQKLIKQYIKLIYNDYQIPDPQPNFQTTYFHRLGGKRQNKINEQDCGKVVKDETLFKGRQDSSKKGPIKGGIKNINKKAIRLKQMFQNQLFSSIQIPNTTIKIANDLRISLSRQENSNLLSNRNSLHSSIKKRNTQKCSNQEVKQIYRYCFVCECPVLEANIQFHQQYKCPQFQRLYQMSLDQLRVSLMNKIQRLQISTQGLYEQMFKNRHSVQKIEKLRYESKQFMDWAKNAVRNAKIKKQKPEMVCFSEMRQNYEKVMKLFQQNYFRLYQNIKKLHWFILMLKDLQDKYYFQPKNTITQKHAQLFSVHSMQLSSRRFSLDSR